MTADFATPGAPSAAAEERLAAALGGQVPDAIDVVWTSPTGVQDPAIHERSEVPDARTST
jgi:hypothetical protein